MLPVYGTGASPIGACGGHCRVAYARVYYKVSVPFVAMDPEAPRWVRAGGMPVWETAPRASRGRSQCERERTVAEAKWFGAVMAVVIAGWFVDYTVLAVAVLLCAALWLVLHIACVRVYGSLRLERGPRPALGRLHATVTLLRCDPSLPG